ncbi:MAG: DUF4230 domain-containing protein [Propionibacteriaceae bacterium]|nr:DUF4230 domain-containing protein [Propionibacteriaceae bacterium]
MKKLTAGLIATVALLLVVVLAMGWVIFGKPLSNSETMKVGPITEEIVQNFKISSLSYRYSNVIYRESVKQIGGVDIPFTGAYLAVRYDGIMDIGIDGSRVRVTTNNNEITITIPPAQILSHSLVPGTTEILFDKGGIANRNKIDDYTKLFEYEREQMELRAHQSGLLEQATVSVKDQLRDFLDSLPGLEDYTIVFQDFDG